MNYYWIIVIDTERLEAAVQEMQIDSIHWLLIADYWLLITDYWLLIADYWLLITDYFFCRNVNC